MKTLPVALLALTGILLTGCATADTGTTADPAPSATAEQAMPEQRQVEAVEVIDPVTIVVTPLKDTDSLYGAEFTVHLTDLIAPVKGECGYAEALAYAEDTAVGNVYFLRYSPDDKGAWIDAAGDHYGSFGNRGEGYASGVVRDGFALDGPDGTTTDGLASTEFDAKNSQVGLWVTCPEFGK